MSYLGIQNVQNMMWTVEKHCVIIDTKPISVDFLFFFFLMSSC